MKQYIRFVSSSCLCLSSSLGSTFSRVQYSTICPTICSRLTAGPLDPLNWPLLSVSLPQGVSCVLPLLQLYIYSTPHITTWQKLNIDICLTYLKYITVYSYLHCILGVFWTRFFLSVPFYSHLYFLIAFTLLILPKRSEFNPEFSSRFSSHIWSKKNFQCRCTIMVSLIHFRKYFTSNFLWSVYCTLSVRLVLLSVLPSPYTYILFYSVLLIYSYF